MGIGSIGNSMSFPHTSVMYLRHDTTFIQVCETLLISKQNPTLLVSLYIIIMNVYVRLSHIIKITYLLTNLITYLLN